MDLKLINKELPVQLTQEELMEKAKELAKLQQDKASAEEQAKSAAATYKDRIASAQSNISILSRDICNGYEYRQVPCQWEFDWSAGKKRLVRNDTGETIKTEMITQDDRQADLTNAA